jgi:5-methylcytosine-specific restriction endonuclease McrA
MSLASLARRDGYRCGICSGPVDLYAEGGFGPSIDHILPVSLGGDASPENLQLSHLVCNVRKRARQGWTSEPVTDTVPEPQLTLFD